MGTLRLFSEGKLRSGFLFALSLAFAGITPARATTINVSYVSVPTAAQAVFNNIVQTYQNLFTNNITVNLSVQFGAVPLGQSSTNIVQVSYATWRAAVIANAAANPLDTYETAAAASLPVANPLGTGNVQLTTADARALGLTNASVLAQSNASGVNPSLDSTLTFSNTANTFSYSGSPTPNLYDFGTTAAHELDEALGIGSTLTSNTTLPTVYAAEDFFRYGAPATRNFTNSSTASVYFSYNNGVTNVANFNQVAGADFNDWNYANGGCPASQVLVQNAYGCQNSVATIGAGTPEAIALETLGYDPTSVATPEPASFALAGASLIALFGLRKRRAARS